MSSDDPRKLQWIVCKDFSPGIADRDYRANGGLGPWPLGTATVDETFGCRALPNGALGPLPWRENSFSLDFPSDVRAGTGVSVLGFFIQGPVRDAPTTGYEDANWFVASEYQHDVAGTNTTEFTIKRLKMWKAGPPYDTIVTDSRTGDSPTHHVCYMFSHRADDNDAQEPGVPGMCYAWWHDSGGQWGFFPDPAAPTTLTPYTISTTYKPSPMIVYQGRSLICNHKNFSNGGGATFRSNENIYYTKSNLLSLQDTVASTFTPEDPGEILAMCVSSANELFVLKRRVGAYVIRGDINFPTVLRIPGIMGTGKLAPIPHVCAIGVVYPSKDNGFYVWPGGEDSICLSEQMEPERFQYDMLDSAPHGSWFPEWGGGSPQFFQDLIFAAPHWVYDFRAQSWWRLEDPDDTEAPLGYLWYQQSVNKTAIIAARAEYFAGENFAFSYNFNFARRSYHWKSHPIPETMNADIEVREVVLRATGIAGSTVTINLYAFGVVETHVFTMSGYDYPRELRQLSALSGGDIQVEIIADGGDLVTPPVRSGLDFNPAPIVYDWRLGFYETQTMPVET